MSGNENGTTRRPAAALSEWWSSRSVNVRRVLAFTASALILAGVIFVAFALSTPSPPKDSARPTRSEFERAEDAYRSGDATAAIPLLRQLLARQPEDAEAKRLLKRILDETTSKGSNTPGDSGGGATKPPATPGTPQDRFLGEIDVTTLLPKTIEGYALGSMSASKTDAVLPGQPHPDNDAPASHLLLSVHDRATPAEAARFITSVSEKLYGENVARFTVSGVPVYFGTDGDLLANASFVRGRYSFEIALTADGVPPADLKKEASDLASQLISSLE